MGQRGEVAPLSDPLQVLVRRPKLLLGRRRVAAPQVDGRPPEEHDPYPLSRLVHDRLAASDDVVGFRLASLHGHERRQPAEDLGLQKRVGADLLQQTFEAPNRIGHRSGTEQERDHQPLDYLPFLEAVTGASSMLERAFRGICARLHVAVEVVRLGDEAPGARQPELVVELIERGDRPLRDIDELARRHLRCAEEP